MIEGKNNSENEDLSEFVDYLAEFDSVIGFDAETCIICGVSISDSLSINNSPFVQYKCVDDENQIIVVTEELESKGIPYKIEKRLKTEMTDEIGYLFEILVPIKFLAELNKIL